MKVVVFVKASPSSEAGVMPSQQLLADMGAYNGELFKAGIMKDGAGLHPTSKAVRVRFTGTDRHVIDGPFAETKELVAGYWIWEVKSMDEAVDWLKKCPNPMPEESEIEIRPIFEADDFKEKFTPELRVREQNLEAALAMEKATVQPYLFFGGRCEEALEFYRTALGAKVVMIMRFNESPEPTPPGMLAPGFESKVMHCSFQVGEGLGFKQNPQFTDETAASIVISDTIYLMLGTHAKFKELTPKEIADPTKVCHTLISLSCESRSAVEDLMGKALAVGGSQAHDPEDHGFMYQHGFYDLDGHGWGLFWMDPAAVQ